MDTFFNKKNIVTAGIIVVSLFLYNKFPAEGFFQGMVLSVFFILILPTLYFKFILKEDISNMGLQEGDWKKGLWWSAAALVGVVGIFYFIYFSTSFLGEYKMPEISKNNFSYFLLFHLISLGTIVFTEVFFRGFLMLGFLRKVGAVSILIQFGLYVVYLTVVSGVNWESIVYIVIAPFSGLVAYKSQSVYYSIAMSLIALILINAIFIKLTS